MHVINTQNVVPADERDCAIILDEMSLRSQTLLDEKAGKIVGHVDYGSIQGEPKEKSAKSCSCFHGYRFERKLALPNRLLSYQQYKYRHSSSNN